MEKELTLANNGFLHLFLGIGMILSPIVMVFTGEIHVLFLLPIVGIIWLIGLFTIEPNQSRVLIFFGKYIGTVKGNGFFWINPFYNKEKVSLRIRNLESEVIKVNDQQGNPILISAIVVWKVIDTYKAVFDLETLKDINPSTGIGKNNPEESYKRFIKIQTESALRKLAHTYPYDNIDESEPDVICLRSGIDEINHTLATEIAERLILVGIEVIEARISNLSYAPEIASAMLRRQQATAVIAARQKIVEGAVGMVKLALESLKEKDIIELDDDKKASMVSNLLVVLCADDSVKPVINTGTLH